MFRRYRPGQVSLHRLHKRIGRYATGRMWFLDHAHKCWLLMKDAKLLHCETLYIKHSGVADIWCRLVLWRSAKFWQSAARSVKYLQDLGCRRHRWSDALFCSYVCNMVCSKGGWWLLASRSFYGNHMTCKESATATSAKTSNLELVELTPFHVLMLFHVWWAEASARTDMRLAHLELSVYSSGQQNSFTFSFTCFNLMYTMKSRWNLNMKVHYLSSIIYYSFSTGLFVTLCLRLSS